MPAGTLRPITNSGGDETDVVGVSDYRDGTAIIKGDVELARKVIHISRIGDVGLQRFGERRNIDEFLWVKTSDRRRGNIPDVVRAGAARCHT